MSFVERSIILCPYLGVSTIGGSTVTHNILPSKTLFRMVIYVKHIIPMTSVQSMLSVTLIEKQQ